MPTKRKHMGSLAAQYSLKRGGMAAVAPRAGERANAYQRRRPETTALYEVVRDNLETLYGAIDDGALAVRLPKHAKKELEAFLDCGLLCLHPWFGRCGFSRRYPKLHTCAPPSGSPRTSRGRKSTHLRVSRT
jgi:hypothetical protein